MMAIKHDIKKEIRTKLFLLYGRVERVTNHRITKVVEWNPVERSRHGRIKNADGKASKDG